MRAAIIEAMGASPRVGELPDPLRDDGAVVIDVDVAVLNPIDLHIAMGRFRDGPPRTPYAPGVEGVGRVVEGSSHSPGTRVRFEVAGLHPGYGQNGSLAERVLAPADVLTPVPEDVDDDTAAALGVTALTAWRVLDVAEVQAGETVAVLGATGAIGRALVQLLRARDGVRVIGVGRDRARLEDVMRLGAHATVAIEDGQARADLSAALHEAAGGTVDVVLDPLWGEPALAAIDAGRVGVRHVNFGQVAGPTAELSSAALLRRNVTLRGISTALDSPAVRAGAYAAALERARAGGLTVAHESFALDRVAEAWARQQRPEGHRVLVAIER
jgi:NADPH:quinone reductase